MLGERARLVEHIGSTSVPGLAAKPVIDIVVGIDDPDDETAYVPDLKAAGYDLRVREPQHRCFRAREWRDVNYYAEAKGPVIAEILARGGWRG